MKSNTQRKSVRWLLALTVIFILAGITGICAQEVKVKPVELNIKEANRELNIMARVLEANLDRSGLPAWQPVTARISAFDAGIKTQYVPSVCAIFTIPVNFPVFDTTKQPEQEEAPQQKEPEDLWDKYAHEDDQAPVQPMVPGGVFTDFSPGMVGMKSGDDKASQKEFLKQAQKQIEHLQNALWETLARYGHRLEHLNAKDEKIVFIVQSPSAPADVFDGRSTGHVNYDWILARQTAVLVKQQIKEKGKSLEQANYYVLVISNAKLSPDMAADDLKSSVTINEYYY